MVQADGTRGGFGRGRVRLRQWCGGDHLVDGVEHRAAILQRGGGVGDAGQHLGVPEAQADKRNGLHRLQGAAHGELGGHEHEGDHDALGEGVPHHIAGEIEPQFFPFCPQPFPVGGGQLRIVGAAAAGAQGRLAVGEFHDAVA